MCACGRASCPSCGGAVQVRATEVPPPAPSGRPPIRRGVLGDPGVSPGFTVQDLGMLRQAARWGLLRPQSRRRFMLTGQFSLAVTDLVELIRAAGGRVEPDADLMAGTVDVLVRGEDGNDKAVELAYDCVVPVWDEAELVMELLPTYDSLVAPAGQPPF